jgi:hypothetical protein
MTNMDRDATVTSQQHFDGSSPQWKSPQWNRLWANVPDQYAPPDSHWPDYLPLPQAENVAGVW